MPVYNRNGKWEVRLQMNGRRYYRQVPEAQNKAQAKIAEAALKLEIFGGNYGREAGKTDFVKFCEEVYLPQMRSQAVTHRTIGCKVKVLCRHFRGKQLRDITQIAVEDYKRRRLAGNSQLGRPRKPVTVKSEINTLSAILNLAIDNGLLGTNPCRRVKFAKGSLNSRRERTLSEDEEARLMPHLDRNVEVKSAVVIALNTGLRRNEIVTRRKADFDPQKRTLFVVRKGGKRQTIPLNATAAAEFERLCTDALPDGRLFRISKNVLTARGSVFKNALKDAGITGLTFHDLRHTFASRMVARGADPFKLRLLMGHESLHMTTHYVSVGIEELREASELLTGGSVIEFHRSFTGEGAEVKKRA